LFHNSTKEGKRETPDQNLIEKFSVPPSCRKSPLSSNEGLFVERGGKGRLFVEKGEKHTSALFFSLPPELRIRRENDHFSLEGEGNHSTSVISRLGLVGGGGAVVMV